MKKPFILAFIFIGMSGCSGKSDVAGIADLSEISGLVTEKGYTAESFQWEGRKHQNRGEAAGSAAKGSVLLILIIAERKRSFKGEASEWRRFLGEMPKMQGHQEFLQKSFPKGRDCAILRRNIRRRLHPASAPPTTGICRNQEVPI